MFQHIKDLVKLDDSGPKAWKLLRDVIQPNTLPMVIVLEKELAALSMRPGNDVKPVLDKIKDTYARMAAAGSNVSQMQQCTKIISVLDNLWGQPHPHPQHSAGPEAAEDVGDGEAEAVGEALAEGESEVTTTRGMGALCFSRPEGWTPPGMKPPSGERARGGDVQGSGAQGSGAQGKANPGMFLMVEDVKGSEGDVGSVGKVVMYPLTHWVIDSGCTSHMTPRADLLDEVKPLGNIKFVASTSGALLFVIGVGNAKEEKSSCIKDLWQLPIIPWSGKLSATVAAAATAKATAGAEETAPSDGALDAVKKVQQPQQPHGEVLAGVDVTAAWAKASSGSGEADWERWHKRLCHVNFPMLQKLVKDGSLKGLEVKGAVKEIASCPKCLENKFTKFPFSSGTGPAKALLALVHMDVVGPTRAPSLSGSCYFLTIVDDHTHARTLLGRAGLPDPFWVTALRQVALVKNRVLATVGDKQWVPYTKWYGSAPAVNMLRAYNCMVFFHVPKEKRGKLEASGRWGVHLGLAKDHKGWLISDLTSQQLTVSRDVMFLESLYYKEWKQHQQKLPTTPLIIEADEVQRPLRQLQYSAVHQRVQRGAADLSKGEMLLTCYTDASFNSVKADGTSIGGYVCLFGGGAMSWRSKKQNEVGLSSCETEYMALHHGVKEVVWLRRSLEEIGLCQREPTVIIEVDDFEISRPFIFIDSVLSLQHFGQREGHVATPFLSRFKCVKGPEEESVGKEERRLIHAAVNTQTDVAFATGSPTAWESKKQVDQALSSVESENMALFLAIWEIVWQRRLMAELGEEQQGPTPL
ncbi:unnamed protein product [Closterium sp. NIES-53]